MMNELRAIIFDFDGVIADTEPLHFAALRQVLADIDIVLTEPEYYADYLGFDDRGCFTAALQRVRGWSIAGDRLTLSDAAGQAVIELESRGPAPNSL